MARLARELNFSQTIAIATRFPDESAELEALGCTTFYRYQDVGSQFANHSLNALTTPDL